jgi:uncharacterized protein (UPF0332 family)
MIKDTDRQALINYRLEQAKDTVELSQFLIDENQLVIAVNRIYYGMYYAVAALALKHRFETSKHSQLIGWFNRQFIANKTLDPVYGKILRNAFNKRIKGDYDAFISFEKEEVLNLHQEMKEFIQALELLLMKN